MLDLTGRWVLVTGCDPGGIGELAMQQLISRGANVLAFVFTEKGAVQARAAGAALACTFDLRDGAALRAASKEALEACQGKLWAVVHNAGVTQAGHFAYQTMDNFRNIMEVNFFAVVELTRQVLPAIADGQGRIVIVSSVDGMISIGGNSPYDASKHAVDSLATVLRLELEPFGVKVSVICPTGMQTQLLSRFTETRRQTWKASAAPLRCSDTWFTETRRQTWKASAARDPDAWFKRIYSEEWLERSIASADATIARYAEPPQEAADHIVHAVSAVAPRMRYLAGRSARVVFWALWSMPESWCHWATNKLLGRMPGPGAPLPAQ
ncbi:putative 11-cis retinol dehydrogenase [Tribonema minus]|uniref:Putative 11-cis retinol dehydrogenase n=1 Tax=Tribonema minus TaxID=303371 RepID=A0A836CJE8_9STRA|nr:putative 11-cis retinol dehydrogenase [Tribonema minus]